MVGRYMKLVAYFISIINMNKKELRKFKNAVWQYLLDHSTKKPSYQKYKITFYIEDEHQFWHKVRVRERGYYSRKDILEEKKAMESIDKENVIRKRKSKRLKKSKNILDIFARKFYHIAFQYRKKRLDRL